MFKYNFIIIFTLFFTLSAEAQRLDLDTEFLNSTSEDFRESVLEQKQSLPAWLSELEQESPDFICLGETHNEKYREFYAENFFDGYSVDTLFLEAKPEEVREIVESIKEGEANVELLGADISAVLNAALNKNPEIKIYGVEPNQEQRRQITFDQSKRLNREGFIAQNIMDKFTPGKKHVMLYGANHCAWNDLGLGGAIPAYRLIKNVLSENTVRSVKAIFYKPSDLFSVNMTIIGLESETMVIKDAGSVDAKSYKHDWKLKKFFDNFTDIIHIK